jgi:transcriptional regulator with XRE-family HTH domain
VSEELPAPSPEGELIRRAREAYIPRLSLRSAAAKVGISVEYWGQVERGYQQAGRGRPVRRVVPGAQTLAQMAYAVEVAPNELEEVGRHDAAEVLEEIIRRQKARQAGSGDSDDGKIVRRMAEFFEDESVSPDEKRIVAERFFKILPYYVAGQVPPRDLLDDDDPSNGSARSA